MLLLCCGFGCFLEAADMILSAATVGSKHAVCLSVAEPRWPLTLITDIMEHKKQ